MALAPPPEPRNLLPPLLACLAAAFASPQPPPALLPLLAPILRQRVSFLSSSTTDGWLPLLSWDTGRGAKLPKAVEHVNLEPHPVSGELELEDVRSVKYRRLDQETLQARLEVEQFDLLPIYVWCENDEHGSSGAGWRLAELRTLDDTEDGTQWFESAAEASEAAGSGAPTVAHTNGHATVAADTADDDDNDDYWAAYDRTPGRTPARTPAKRSPAPFASSAVRSTMNREEDDYYARYGEEVQPAMDSHDPDEDYGEAGQSTLNGHALAGVPAPVAAPARTDSADYYASLQPHKEWQANDSAIATATDRSPEQTSENLSMPRPISPASSHSSIGHLEEKAAEMSSGNDQAQLAVKQHISTDVKSLYRLAKASGMSRADFEGIVRRELDVLSMFDEDERAVLMLV
ncbi:hypothetical protein Slin15195_G001550 [Septoria linicola]|uniref:Uncharacterized protein n=1 Tax=Septoria linicola TaxID=215465 RepID=A0A9Q9AJ32_9PEZI|nr:hypothetical protein Slin14017_G001580 [Septoria linicola]USW46836.1 hypothetical protein Slin15195_G001550 [Septoria linicola]